ncbi:unnamed protein product [Rotaria sp. Silwood2]|nr:unnamed protein product [Rotaria sp. Silwood2]CAF4302366.1 unnamed protein product [Rotaria sp. Silwood2]
MNASSKCPDNNKEYPSSFTNIYNRLQPILKSTKRLGVHTACHIIFAGFEYTGNGDTTRCKDCGLEVSNWTLDMDPFAIHSKRRPDCPFVCNIKLSSFKNVPASSASPVTTTVRNTSILNEQENPSKRQKVETMHLESLSHTLLETVSLQQVRRRTFSHWSHRTIPLSVQMIDAGFFNCNVGDRVICIYCNLICQQWTPNTDDPREVHKTLSPTCIYAKAKLIHPVASPIIIVNEGSTSAISGDYSPTSNNLGPLRSNDIVFTASCNPAYSDISKRHASFETWPNEGLPPVNDLVRAGFFYTGAKTIVTCFYCNGSLQNWGPNDNPMIEHARWFPQCTYARQLCGEELYHKIQESQRAPQERARTVKINERAGSPGIFNTNLTTNSQQLLILNKRTLLKLVAARLDLPMSQRLLNQNFKLSIIKRCWKDQLRIKHDDFASDCDLYIACLIRQKQIEYIDGSEENIIIPKTHVLEQISFIPSVARISSNSTNVEMTSLFQSLTNESASSQSYIVSISRPATIGNEYETQSAEQTSTGNYQNQSINAAPPDPCVLCLKEEKRLACIPCGHMTTCTACSHLLRSCSICRREIEAFVRIYV